MGVVKKNNTKTETKDKAVFLNAYIGGKQIGYIVIEDVKMAEKMLSSDAEPEVLGNWVAENVITWKARAHDPKADKQTSVASLDDMPM